MGSDSRERPPARKQQSRARRQAGRPLGRRRLLLGIAGLAFAGSLRAEEPGNTARFTAHGPLWRTLPVDVAGPIPYFIDEPDAARGGGPRDRWLAERALQAWDDVLEGWLCFTPSRAVEAAIRVYWGMTGDRLGLMQAIEAGPYRGGEVYVDPRPEKFHPRMAEAARADPLFRDAVLYRTLLHEVGHSLGLVHTIDLDDAMYFGGDFVGFYKAYRAKLETIEDIRRHPGLSAKDVTRVRAMYPPEALLRQQVRKPPPDAVSGK